MSKTELPDWANDGDMPKAFPMGNLCWQDLYFLASDELLRSPTKAETKQIFDAAAKRLPDAMGKRLSDDLQTVIEMEVESLLKEKPYDHFGMKGEELTSKKYCHECKEVQKTYWQLNNCEKNPEGLEDFKGYHGGNCDNTCEDEYCNPESLEVDDEDITAEYVKEHRVFELCTVCHGYFDDAGPQAVPPKTDLEDSTEETQVQTSEKPDGMSADEMTPQEQNARSIERLGQITEKIRRLDERLQNANKRLENANKRLQNQSKKLEQSSKRQKTSYKKRISGFFKRPNL